MDNLTIAWILLTPFTSIIITEIIFIYARKNINKPDDNASLGLFLWLCVISAWWGTYFLII